MRFLYNSPAIFHKGALIIGDTHFGIEERLRKQGIHYANISEQILEKILLLIKRTKAKKLIMLGDVKENITSVDDLTKKSLRNYKRTLRLLL